jgi:putative Holliday junction resolvase
MTTFIGLDFGLKKIGVAKAHSSLRVALPLTQIIASPKAENTVKLLINHLKDYGPIEAFVIGFPLLLSGEEGEMCQKVRAFASLLEEMSQIPVVLFDERLTSKQAETLLLEREMNRKKRAAYSDMTSATLILQSYLESTSLK